MLQAIHARTHWKLVFCLWKRCLSALVGSHWSACQPREGPLGLLVATSKPWLFGTRHWRCSPCVFEPWVSKLISKSNHDYYVASDYDQQKFMFHHGLYLSDSVIKLRRHASDRTAATTHGINLQRPTTRSADQPIALESRSSCHRQTRSRHTQNLPSSFSPSFC